MHAHANVDISASSGGVPPSPTSPTGILKKSSGQPVYKSSKFDKKCIGDGLVFFAFGSRLSLSSLTLSTLLECLNLVAGLTMDE